MDLVLWLAASILALNALIFASMFVVAYEGRHRVRKEVRQLEALWHLDPAATTRFHRRKLVAVSLAAAVAFAGVAVVTPKARRVMLPGPSGEESATSVRAVDGRSHTGTSGSVPMKELGAGSEGDVSTEGTDDPVATSSGSVAPTTGGVAPPSVAALPRSSNVIRISWDAVPQATGYGVERSLNRVAGWQIVATVDHDVASYLDAGLAPETTYYYRITSHLEGIPPQTSDVVSATTPTEPPDPTTVTLATTSRTSVGLLWTDVATETGYVVERSNDGLTGWVAIGTTGLDVTTYTDSGLLGGTTYFYRVFAVNDGGMSAPSGVVSGTTEKGNADIAEGSPPDPSPSPIPDPSPSLDSGLTEGDG